MKALKALVMVMALLLIGGLGLLGYGVATKVAPAKAGHGQPMPAAVESGDFGAVEVPLPAGGHIEQMAVAGERVVLRVGGAGAERLIVLDPASGRVAGSFVLAPQPAGASQLPGAR